MTLDDAAIDLQALAWPLFGIGMATMVLRRHMAIMLMGPHLMLLAAALSFAGTARAAGQPMGQLLSALVLAVAAIAWSIGLTLARASCHMRRSLDVDELDMLRDAT